MNCKTVLITGASRGIGAQMALEFGHAGWNVVINYHIHKLKADELAAAIGRNALALQADISSESEVKQMFLATRERFLHVDVLINNAGVAKNGLFSDVPDADIRQLFDLNFFGTCHCIREALPEMVSRKEGKIINISSVWGIVGASCEAWYSASKAAVIGLTKSLAKELAPSNIQVNCIAPGVIDTDMNACMDDASIRVLEEEIPLGRIGTANNVAPLALFLASEKADYITGQVIRVDGGFCM